jgi:rhamnogalacturonan acetylesterase
MKNMGAAQVNAGYPNDHTHTGPGLADVMAKTFVLGLKCGTSGLGSLAVNETAALTATTLGGCIAHNSTLPVRGLDAEVELLY